MVKKTEPLLKASPAPPRLQGRQRACMIVEGGRVYCIDPLEDTLRVLSKRWALLVIGILGNADEVRFSQAKQTIPGISARALSDVLSVLQDERLVKRDVDPSQSPPAVSYALTRRGRDLRKALLPLLAWADQTGG